MRHIHKKGGLKKEQQTDIEPRKQPATQTGRQATRQRDQTGTHTVILPFMFDGILPPTG